MTIISQGNAGGEKLPAATNDNKQKFVDKLLPLAEKCLFPDKGIFGGFLRGCIEARLRKEAPVFFRENPFNIKDLPNWQIGPVSSTKSIKMPGGILHTYLSAIDWRWASQGYELIVDLRYWPDNIFSRSTPPRSVNRVSILINPTELQQLLTQSQS